MNYARNKYFSCLIRTINKKKKKKENSKIFFSVTLSFWLDTLYETRNTRLVIAFSHKLIWFTNKFVFFKLQDEKYVNYIIYISTWLDVFRLFVQNG